MKQLLLKVAKESGIVDAEQLAKVFEENKNDTRRIDEMLLMCPHFTEEAVLKLFARALRLEYFSDIPAEACAAGIYQQCAGPLCAASLSYRHKIRRRGRAYDHNVQAS